MADLPDAGAADDDDLTDADIQKPVAKRSRVDANKSVNIIVPTTSRQSWDLSIRTF